MYTYVYMNRVITSFTPKLNKLKSIPKLITICRYELVDESVFDEEDEEEDTEEEKARKTKSELMRRLSLMRYNSVQPITVSIDHSTQIISRKPSSLVRR